MRRLEKEGEKEGEGDKAYDRSITGLSQGDQCSDIPAR